MREEMYTSVFFLNEDETTFTGPPQSNQMSLPLPLSQTEGWRFYEPI